MPITANIYPLYMSIQPTWVIMCLDSNAKRYLLFTGSCQPTGPFSRDPAQDNRSFTTAYLQNKVWFGDTEDMDVLLPDTRCSPVGFLPSQHGKQIPGVIYQRKFNNTSHPLTLHKSACVTCDHWRQNGTMDKDMKRDILREASFWRQVLHRVINVTLTLAMNNIPFRGHRENIGEMNNGNFLSVIELLAMYDPVLKDLISCPARSIKYLSPLIKNELIEILAKHTQTF